jgi:hypothetical protein
MPCKLNYFFPIFSIYVFASLPFQAQGRRQREFTQEDVGLHKGGCQLYSPMVLQLRR